MNVPSPSEWLGEDAEDETADLTTSAGAPTEQQADAASWRNEWSSSRWSQDGWQGWWSSSRRGSDSWRTGDWKRQDWWKSSAPSSSSRHWHRGGGGEFDGCLYQNHDQLLQVNLSRRKLGDDGLTRFCQWLPHELQRRRLKIGEEIVKVSEMDLSQNGIGDVGIQRLVETFSTLKVVVGTLKLFKNRMGQAGATALASWIRSSTWPLFELHLSHNYITTEGAEEILQAIAQNSKYPSQRPGGKQQRFPLWLRLEGNNIEKSFQESAESVLRAARPEVTSGPLICWVSDRSDKDGCRSGWCKWTPTYKPGQHVALVHLTYIFVQHKSGKGEAVVRDDACNLADAGELQEQASCDVEETADSHQELATELQCPVDTCDAEQPLDLKSEGLDDERPVQTTAAMQQVHQPEAEMQQLRSGEHAHHIQQCQEERQHYQPHLLQHEDEDLQQQGQENLHQQQHEQQHQRLWQVFEHQQYDEQAEQAKPDTQPEPQQQQRPEHNQQQQDDQACEERQRQQEHHLQQQPGAYVQDSTNSNHGQTESVDNEVQSESSAESVD